MKNDLKTIKNSNKKVETKEKPILYNKLDECCGCTACYSICPVGAINMVEGYDGFLYPQVDSDKCIRCYQCLKVCPIKTYDNKIK